MRQIKLLATFFILIYLMSPPSLDAAVPQDQVVYKIQVASHIRQFSVDRVKRDLGLNVTPTVHFINGRYKYFVGSYASWNEANSHVAEVPVTGAFVVRVNVPAGTKTEQDKPVVQEQPAVVQQQPSVREPVVQAQQTSTELAYRIQVAASRVFINPERVKISNKLDQQVSYFVKDGWYKYVIGDFASTQAAENYIAQSGIKGFVISAPISRDVTAQTDTVTNRPIVKQELRRDPGSDQRNDDSTRVIGIQDPRLLGRPSTSQRPVEGAQQGQQRARPSQPQGYQSEGALSTTGIQELYNDKIRQADSAYVNGDLALSRKFYSEARRLKPAERYPEDRIQLIDAESMGKARKPISNRLPGLIYGVGIFLVIMVIVLIAVLVYRQRRLKQQKESEKLKDEYQDSITEYLFDEGAEKPAVLTEAGTQKKKQMLIDEIMQLYANLSGEISNKLRELYIDLGLDNESVKKTQSPQWHIRAKGFRELAQMNIKTVNDEIEKCLNSENDVLRMEAQLAMIRLNYENPFGFLDHMERPFSSWEQLHVYEMIHRNQVSVPDFTKWLDSRNETIVVFCIRMIRAFKQAEAFERITTFLQSPVKDIKNEAIITVGELRNEDGLAALRENYHAEPQETKVLILQAMAKMPNDSSIDFLTGILEPSNDLRIEAADALARIESFGVRGIENILRRSDEDLQAVARHILENRI